MLHQGEQIRSGTHQLDTQGLIIESLHSDLIKIGDFTAVIVLRTFQYEQIFGVLCAERSRQHPLVRENKILGSDRFAVRPLSVFPDVKCPNRIVFVVFPAIRHTRERPLIDRRYSAQPIPRSSP